MASNNTVSPEKCWERDFFAAKWRQPRTWGFRIGVVLVVIGVLVTATALSQHFIKNFEIPGLQTLGKTWHSGAIAGGATATVALATWGFLKVVPKPEVFEPVPIEEEQDEEEESVPVDRTYSRREQDGVNLEWIMKDAERRVRNLRR